MWRVGQRLRQKWDSQECDQVTEVGLHCRRTPLLLKIMGFVDRPDYTIIYTSITNKASENYYCVQRYYARLYKIVWKFILHENFHFFVCCESHVSIYKIVRNKMNNIFVFLNLTYCILISFVCLLWWFDLDSVYFVLCVQNVPTSSYTVTDVRRLAPNPWV